MSRLSFFATFRFAVWRELYARAGLLGILLGLLAIEALLSPRGREPWEAFVLFLILPPFAVALALRAPARADTFWRGLGGCAAARGLGAAVVHLGALFGTAGLLALAAGTRGEFMSESYDCSFGLYCGLLGALWSLVFAGRAVASGLTAAAPLVFTAAALGGITTLAEHWGRWPAADALFLRIALVGVAALVLGIVLEGPVGAWGGAVRKRGFGLRSMLAAFGLLLLVSFGTEAASPPHWAITGAEWAYVAPDGSVAYRDSDAVGWRRTPWTQRWTPQDGLEWWHHSGAQDDLFGPGSLSDLDAGPRGAVFFEDRVTWPDGRTTSCGASSYGMSWSPEGEAVVLWLAGDPGSWAIATPAGCTELPKSVSQVTLRTGGELVFVRGKQLFVGPSVDTARTIPFSDGAENDRLWAYTGASMTLVARQTAQEQSLFLLRGESLVPLATAPVSGTSEALIRRAWDTRLASFYFLDGCAVVEGALSCWNEDAERIVGPLSMEAQDNLVVLARGWLWDLEENALHRPSDGARLALSDGKPGRADERRYMEHVAILPDGRARHFSRGGNVRDFDLPD